MHHRAQKRPRKSPMRPLQAIAIALLILALANFAVISFYYSKFTWDDAYITFRYARNFAEGNGLVYNIGDHVEGYSNFSWLLLLSLSYRLGIDMILAAKVLALCSAALTIIFMTALTRRYVKNSLLQGAPAFLLLLTYGFAAYTMSGLETVFFMCLLTAGAYFFAKGHDESPSRVDIASSVIFGIMALTRPEGILFFGFFILLKLVLLRRAFFSWRNIGAVALGVLPFAAYFLFRIFYFGSLVPNSVIAKSCVGIVPFIFGIVKGIRYTGLFLFSPIMLLILVPIALGHRRIAREPALLMISGFLVLATLAYTVYGGDWMSFFRLYIHLLPLILALGIVCLDSIVPSPSLSSRPAQNAAFAHSQWLFIIIALVLLGAATVWNANELFLVQKPSESAASYLVYEQMGSFIKQRSRPGDVLVYGGIGSIGYYSDIRIRDILALVDRHLASLPGCIASTDFGYGAVLYPQRKFDVDYDFKDNPRFIMIDSLDDVRATGNLTTFELNEQLIIKDPRFANYTRVYTLKTGGYLHLFEYDPEKSLVAVN